MDRHPIEPHWPYGTVAMFIINQKKPGKPIEVVQLQVHKVRRTFDGWKVWAGHDPKHPLVFRVDEKGESVDVVPWDHEMELQSAIPVVEPETEEQKRQRAEAREAKAQEIKRLNDLIGQNPRPAVIPDEETAKRVSAHSRREWAESLTVPELRQFVQKKREELAEAERLLEKAEQAQGVDRHEL